MSGQMYVIKWRAIKTGATGQGTKGFPKAEAQRMADEMNEDDKDFVYHWIILQPEPPQAEAKP